MNPPDGIDCFRDSGWAVFKPVYNEPARSWRISFLNTMLISTSIYGNNHTARQADQLIAHVEAQTRA